MKKLDKDLFEDIKSGTNIVTGEEYQQIIMAISDVASEMVVKTLGPYGSTTLVDDSDFAYPTKDGWSVLKRLRFNDPVYNTLYNVLKKVSFSLADKVGDGTTSAIIGANVFMHKIAEYQEENEFRQTDFLDILSTVSEDIIKELTGSKYVRHIDRDGDYSDIKAIAEIASNNNTELAEIIQAIYQQTSNPNIYISLDNGRELTYAIENGYKIDANPLNHKAYINTDANTCIKNERSLLAIFDHSVTYNEHGSIITLLSKYASANNKEIVIIAPHFDDIITNIIGTNINHFIQQKQIPNIMLVQVPLSMDIHRTYLSDFVLLTNAQVFDYGKVRACNVLLHNAEKPDEKIEDALLQTEQYNFETPSDIFDICLGMADKLVVADTYMVVQEYENIINKDLYANTLKEAEAKYLETKQKAEKTATMLHKEYMDAYQRYTKLVGKMGIIKVGGISELERQCVKDSVDDAVLACRSAYNNGYIRGLNISTLKIISNMIRVPRTKFNNLKMDVLEMMYCVFKEMSMNVLRNKYSDNFERTVDFSLSANNLMDITDDHRSLIDSSLTNEQIIDACVEYDVAYNLVTEAFELPNECTVVNSLATDVEIIKAIVGVLSIMLTSNQLLSVNRMYDRKIGRRQLLDSRIADKIEMTNAIADAVLENLETRYNEGKQELNLSGFGKFIMKIFGK